MNTQRTASSSDAVALSSWRMKGMVILRIAFDLVWAIDAWFKWQPDFINSFSSYSVISPTL